MLAVALIAFALFNFVGDPINNMVGQDTSLADRERLRQELGLNDSFVVQFAPLCRPRRRRASSACRTSRRGRSGRSSSKRCRRRWS